MKVWANEGGEAKARILNSSRSAAGVMAQQTEQDERKLVDLLQ